MIPFITDMIAKESVQKAVPRDDSYIDQLVYGTPGQFDLPPGFEPMEGTYQTLRQSRLQHLPELPSHVGNARYDKLNLYVR